MLFHINDDLFRSLELAAHNRISILKNAFCSEGSNLEEQIKTEVSMLESFIEQAQERRNPCTTSDHK